MSKINTLFRLAIAVGTLSMLPVVGYSWTVESDFESEVTGTQTTFFNDAHAKTFVSENEHFSGKKSLQLNVREGTSGWPEWGGRKMLPETLHEGDEIWIRLRTLMPAEFDYSTDFALKFLRTGLKTADGQHLGYVDIYIRNNGGYKYQSELYSTNRIALQNIQGNFTVGEKVVGAKSGAEAKVVVIKPDALVIESTNDIKFAYFEGVTGQTSGAKATCKRQETNSVTNFGDENIIEKGVWETYVYHVRYSTTNPLVQFYKQVGGELKMLFEETTDKTLRNPTDVVDAFLLFTYWNSRAPKTQSMYVDDIWISTNPPPEFKSGGSTSTQTSILLPPTNVIVEKK